MNKPTQAKPREFWISKRPAGHCGLNFTYLVLEYAPSSDSADSYRKTVDFEAYLVLKKQAEVLVEACKRVNQYLSERKVFDDTNGDHMRMYEFMQVTEALAAFSDLVGK